jgi:ABC-type nitrate/sulfonate/bicarbonate transport system permease component
VLSVIGTIVGEFVGTTTGLGRVLLDYNFAFDIARMIALLDCRGGQDEHD